MKKTEFSFSRIEKKYMLSERKYLCFLEALNDKLIPDEYAEYSIHNIYYDTEDDYLIRRSIEKPKYKEKLRLRSYGCPSDNERVFIEIKKKCLGVVGKRRISLPYHEAIDYLDRGIAPRERNQIFNEIDYFIRLYKPVAKQFVSYDRQAFTYADNKSVRITFDRNIAGRRSDLSICNSMSERTLLADGSRLMEIKTPGAIPIEIASVLSELQIFPCSFSKYGTFYKEYIKDNLEVTQCSTASSRQVTP